MTTHLRVRRGAGSIDKTAINSEHERRAECPLTRGWASESTWKQAGTATAVLSPNW